MDLELEREVWAGHMDLAVSVWMLVSAQDWIRPSQEERGEG